jgi:hypothetical protein
LGTVFEEFRVSFRVSVRVFGLKGSGLDSRVVIEVFGFRAHGVMPKVKAFDFGVRSIGFDR